MGAFQRVHLKPPSSPVPSAATTSSSCFPSLPSKAHTISHCHLAHLYRGLSMAVHPPLPRSITSHGVEQKQKLGVAPPCLLWLEEQWQKLIRLWDGEGKQHKAALLITVVSCSGSLAHSSVLWCPRFSVVESSSPPWLGHVGAS